MGPLAPQSWGMRALFLLALCGALALGQDLQVRRLSPPATVRPGDFAVQVWQVTNLSPNSLTVSLELEVPAGWEALGVPSTLVLGPGEEEYLFCALHVPRTAQRGTYPVRLRLRWDGQEVGSEAQIEVEAVAALALFPPSPQAGQPGEALEFSVQVVNRGNAVDRVAVSVRTASGWRVAVRPSALSLSPGERGEVRVIVWIPEAAGVGREVVLAQARSETAPEVEVRSAWYVEVLPPGPERVSVRTLAELATQGFARFSYDFLSESGTSVLGFSGRGTAFSGALELSGRWTGPWASQPLALLDFQALYLREDWGVTAGRTSFSFGELFSPLSFWGLEANVSLPSARLDFGSGWLEETGRAAGTLVFQPAWGELGWAYREERASATHSRGGALWLALQALEDLWFRFAAGAALVQGLTRFAGETALTWEVPELFFLEARGYASDPAFPGLVQDRAGTLLSGRLGAPEAGLRFTLSWERDNLRALSPLTRGTQSVQVSWNLSPPAWAWSFSFGLGLRRVADISWPPTSGERTLSAEAGLAFSQAGFTLGAKGMYTRTEDVLSRQTWVRQEYQEWLNIQAAPGVSLAGELRQVLFFAPGEERTEAHTTISFSVQEKLFIRAEHSPTGGVVQAEISVVPGPPLVLKFGAEARWQGEGQPTRLRVNFGFSYTFSWAPPFLPIYGMLTGVVFADLNGNGRRDPGEPGVPGAVLSVETHQVSTGKTGEFRFPGLPPGSYTLAITSLPQGYGAPTREFPVTVALAEETRISLGVLPWAELEGEVFLDADGDGKRDPGEPGLARVLVRVVSPGLSLELLSDVAGRFGWTELFPGAYRVELLPELLPPRHELTTPQALDLALRPGQKITVSFGVRERPRPLIMIQPPLAEFVWTPSIPRAGASVLFDGTFSQAFDGEIVGYAWDFDGDGRPDAEGARVTWTFPAPGFYLVTLQVTDSAGLTGETQYLVEVRP